MTPDSFKNINIPANLRKSDMATQCSTRKIQTSNPYCLAFIHTKLNIPSTLCANILFTVTYSPNRVDRLLAQPLVHLIPPARMQVFRTFQHNACQNVCVRDRDPLLSHISFPIRARQMHAVLFLARWWVFFYSQCLFVAQKNYRGLPGC